MESDSSFGVKFIDPEKVLAQADLKPGSVVADFGCGTGYFSLAVARAVGSEGVVYSLDILPQRLESVESQAKNFGLTNIITQRVNLEKIGGSKLPDKSVDWVVIKDMLFQNQDKKIILDEAKRVLKDDGKVLLIEWSPEDSGIGPEKRLRLTEEAAVDLAQQEGMWVFKKIDAGNFHYGLVLMK
jgi:ubiquinone/menaquinone biosynthesis C-methylase UbiE